MTLAPKGRTKVVPQKELRSPPVEWLRKWHRKTRRALSGLVLPWLGPPALARLARSWRVEVVGREHYEDCRAQPGMLLALWHGRMVMAMPPHERQGITVLVSPSDDGSLVTSLLARFGFGIIRGSTSRGQFRALREMVRTLKDAGRVAITPDGPRGPRHSMNAGLAWMSSVTGFPILPCGFVSDRAWHLRSWDRFTIPKPRARMVLVYGEPVYVARGADEAAIDEATELVRARTLAAEEHGFAHLGQEPDW